MKIYKYSWSTTSERRMNIEMPKNAKILDVQFQNLEICIWALVDPANEFEPRTFEVIGTGWNIENSGRYLATVQQGGFVWHVFEMIKEDCKTTLEERIESLEEQIDNVNAAIVNWIDECDKRLNQYEQPRPS